MRRSQRCDKSPYRTTLRISTSPTSPPLVPPAPLDAPLSVTSASLSPISPRSSSPPSQTLTPPPRLHFRNLLPSLPITRLQWTLAPQMPHPWAWRCHICKSYYRLSVTRRCLKDGHFFCSVFESPQSSVLSDIVKDEAQSDDIQDEDCSRANSDKLRKPREEIIKELHARRKHTSREKTNNRRKIYIGCCAEFDYTGWDAYNKWRREVRSFNIYSVARPRTWIQTSGCLTENENWIDFTNLTKRSKVARPITNSTSERKGRNVRPRSNCWKDCNFPSECLNQR